MCREVCEEAWCDVNIPQTKRCYESTSAVHSVAFGCSQDTQGKLGSSSSCFPSLQVCVSSECERPRLQSPAAVPTASEEPGNNGLPPSEAQTWVGMAQLPSVSSKHLTVHSQWCADSGLCYTIAKFNVSKASFCTTRVKDEHFFMLQLYICLIEFSISLSSQLCVLCSV